MRDLTGVSVRGLLGTFDHSFDFPASWEFVILHGPNGIGKTKLLELTHAVLRRELAKIAEIPFASIQLTFADGSALNVFRVNPVAIKRSTKKVQRPPEYREHPQGTHLRYWYREEGRSPRRWTTSLPQGVENLKGVERIAREEWTLRDLAMIMERVERHDPERAAAMLDYWRYSRSVHSGKTAEIPEYTKLIQDVNIHLIETQRLLDLTHRAAKKEGVAAVSGQSRAASYSADIARRIKEMLAESSPVSQELDRTFPARVLADDIRVAVPSDQKIRDEYYRQARLRERLAEIDLLEEFEEVPLPEVLLDWQRRVLWTYLRDARRKLAFFDEFLAKLELLIEVTNARFLGKRLRVDRDKGFVFTTPNGDEIRPEQLSSGEQHELVLVYDLLFIVEPGSLVLIDEPEISLHVGWQREFLNDIVRIARLTSLRFVVATHSPQIAHKWIDRIVALVPESGDQEDEGDAVVE